MLSYAASILLTGTAMAPVGLTYGAMAILEGAYLPGLVLIAACLVLWLACLGLLATAKGTFERVNVAISSVELVDRDSMGILVLYLFPLIGGTFGELTWHLLVPLGVIFLSLVVTSHYHHFNPLLNLLGWHYFRIQTKGGISYLLISKRELRSSAELLVLAQLTKYTLIEVGRHGNARESVRSD